jgi:EAL domain-containing protein (putative c-di-GMP-specific phosphodiesterase class I)
VLDLAMPEMDGGELMEWLSKQGSKARILIVSGCAPVKLAEAEADARSLGLRITGSLQKPLRVEKLRSAFREIYDDAEVLSAQDICGALTRREIRLVYQPQIDLRTGGVTGFEALARWDHPKRGAIPPDIFIPILEAHEFIDEFTSQILDIALSDVHRWNGTGLFRVAINVSAANLRTMALDEKLLERCAYAKIDCNRVTVEITETAAMTETAQLSARLERLNGCGVQLSIDDFGTGYSSLVKLHQLPFSELKIDKSFVMNCPAKRQGEVLVQAMIDLAHNLNMKVVAEGVETEQMLRLLTQWGCDAAQGYFIARPMPPDAAKLWLNEQKSR